MGWATRFFEMASFRQANHLSGGALLHGEHMHNAYVASDLLAAMAFWLVALLAAGPAFAIMRQGRRGCARSAIAYLAGFFLGLALTVGLSFAAAALMRRRTALFNAGVTAAFLGPFTGLVHAAAAARGGGQSGPRPDRSRWRGPHRQSIPRARRLL